MTDSISAIGHAGASQHASRAAGIDAASVAEPSAVAVGAAGTEALLARVHAGIVEARALGAEAQRAAALVRSGTGSDVEGVMLATRKADAAFRMLEAVRNAMIEAYSQANGVRA